MDLSRGRDAFRQQTEGCMGVMEERNASRHGRGVHEADAWCGGGDALRHGGRSVWGLPWARVQDGHGSKQSQHSLYWTWLGGWGNILTQVFVAA